MLAGCVIVSDVAMMTPTTHRCESTETFVNRAERGSDWSVMGGEYQAQAINSKPQEALV